MDLPHDEGLSPEEDDALRRLAYFAENAGLSEWSKTRLSELRSRDRRDEIRLPREIVGEMAFDSNVPGAPVNNEAAAGSRPSPGSAA